MKLKIRTKKLANGYETAFFDIHYNGIRKSESTGIKYKINPVNLLEKDEKKQKQRLIQKLASTRELELLNAVNGMTESYNPTFNIVAYIDNFIANHPVQEIKKFKSARNMLVSFAGKDKISCYELTENYLRKFVNFLESKLNGESPSNYFAKLKQIFKAAVSDGILSTNPAANIKVRKNSYLQKDVLTISEIQTLAQTPLNNQEVKNAFLFCLLTGLRFCDVKILKWSDVFSNKISIIQKKTKVALDIPLSANAKQLLPGARNPHELVFNLPSHTSCQIWIKRLVSDAGIEKKISWHSGRHSFGTNLIAHGVDVSVASKLLGHTSLANTQRYIKVNEEMKAKAIAQLPTIDLV